MVTRLIPLANQKTRTRKKITHSSLAHTENTLTETLAETKLKTFAISGKPMTLSYMTHFGMPADSLGCLVMDLNAFYKISCTEEMSAPMSVNKGIKVGD
jgi:hypothetical protein